jgi:hypothetical protein
VKRKTDWRETLRDHDEVVRLISSDLAENTAEVIQWWDRALAADDPDTAMTAVIEMEIRLSTAMRIEVRDLKRYATKLVNRTDRLEGSQL